MKPNILKTIIHICLYLVLFAPFLVWGKFLFPYITPKTLFFRILIEIALFFYILLIIYQPEYRPRFSKITWIVLIYFLVMTFASIFGVDLYHSFWGNIERGEGLLTTYHLFIFFILITSLFKEKKEWFRFFNISIFVSLLVSFYAFLQEVGVSFLLPSAGGTRLTATIGNASFLAAYLLFNIFLCLFLFANVSRPGRSINGWRIFYGLSFLFETYILFQTETRGALLGFFGGLLLLAILSVVFSKNKKLKLSFVVLFLLLLVLAATIWFCRGQAWVTNNSTLNRLVGISFTDVTTQSRLLGWQASWRGWQDRFIFGYGYENYNIAFNKYFPVLIYRDPGSQVWFDRAHNIIFDQAVPGGLFGLLTYLGILGITFWALWSKLWLNRKKQNHPQENQETETTTSIFNPIGFIILICLLAAYFLQNFFVFDTLGTYLLFYSVLGFVSYLSLSKDNSSKDVSNENISSRRPKPFLVIVLLVFSVFSIYIFNIKPAMANILSVKGLSYAYQNMYREAMAAFKQSLSYNTNQAPETRHNLVNITVNAIRSGQFSQDENKENLAYAIKELEKNIEMSSLDARHYMFTMSLYGAVGQSNHYFYDKVIELGQQALKLSPTRPQTYYLMGQAEIGRGNAKQGVDYFKKAVELNPSVMESHWNLLTAYLLVGENELAQEEINQMKELGFNYYSMDSLERLSKIYAVIKDFQKVSSLYEEMIKLSPDNPDLYAKLAAAYKEIGEIEKAKWAVKKAVELDPGFQQEAELFLKLLEEIK